MKNESQFAKKFITLFKRVKKTVGQVEPVTPLDPIGQVVLGLLQWESTTTAAAAAFDRLMNRMVDQNDLRVSHPQEIKVLIGQRYGKVDDRISRLLTILQEIYIRQYAVSLNELARKSKKEIRTYLDSLPGMPPYVAAQVTLLCFGGHAVPVDQMLVNLLVKEGVIHADASVREVESFLERRIRATDAVAAHTVLRAWADAHGQSSSASSKSVRGAGTRVVKKKKSASATTKKKVKKKTSRSAANK